MSGHIDPLELARALLRCPSVTPADGGALATLAGAVEGLGFRCETLTFSEAGTPDVGNLFARLGSGRPHLCFAGHTDVVPIGDPEAWSIDPFGAEIRGGVLFGRGAADMKGAIAAFVGAASRFLTRRGGRFDGSLSLLITGDEEGPAINGTAKVLRWMAERGEIPDSCLVGEPTNPLRLGETIKIGRRGSLAARIAVAGVQGHTAYPQLADNPLPRLVRILAALTEARLDDGTEHFQPSDLQLTSIDVGNPAANVIPGSGSAAFNIRFNDLHTGESLSQWIRDRLAEIGGDAALDIHVSGEAFLTPPGRFTGLLARAVADKTGIAPELGTAGGTSDARFIKQYCEVAEFGLVGQTMHKIDERVDLADLAMLGEIYEAVIDSYFAG